MLSNCCGSSEPSDFGRAGVPRRNNSACGMPGRAGRTNCQRQCKLRREGLSGTILVRCIAFSTCCAFQTACSCSCGNYTPRAHNPMLLFTIVCTVLVFASCRLLLSLVLVL